MRFSSGFVLSLLMLAYAGTAFADASIRSVVVRGEGERAELAIEGEFSVPTYSVRATNQGRTVVIDVAGAKLPSGGIATKGQASFVKSVVGSTTARGARIEVTLAEALAYRARAESGEIRVSFSRIDANEPAAAAAADASGPLTIEDIHLERRDGRDRVVVKTTRAAEFKIGEPRDGNVNMEIRGARVSPRIDREVQGSSDGLVRRVRVSETNGRVRVSVEGFGAASTTAIREGNRIVWLFAPESSSEPRRSTKTIAREDLFGAGSAGDEEEVSTVDVASFLTDAPLQSRKGEPKFTGRRIDLDFKNADIHDILRLFADVGGLNVVTADNVGGRVTIKMRDVPWDQALDVVLQAKGLGMMRRGNLIRVAQLSTLEKERESAIARLKQREQLAPLETRLVPVSYATAGAVQPRVRELLSSRGSVSVDERTNMLIVRDIVDNLDDVEALVRTLDTQTP
ncbi:MAG: AMIN domain-containing protein, partial [Myxococcales bacterium]|nr:AMIN domain-containing protein [Myxococcales bacterium]